MSKDILSRVGLNLKTPFKSTRTYADLDEARLNLAYKEAKDDLDKSYEAEKRRLADKEERLRKSIGKIQDDLRQDEEVFKYDPDWLRTNEELGKVIDDRKEVTSRYKKAIEALKNKFQI